MPIKFNTKNNYQAKFVSKEPCLNNNAANNYENKSSVSFKGFYGVKRLSTGKVVRQTTSFFRDSDILTSMLLKLKELFPEGEVPIVNYACSAGEESYSLAMLISLMTNRVVADKRMPIFSFDLDPDVIKMAKNGVYRVFTGSSDECLVPVHPRQYLSGFQLQQRDLVDRFFQVEVDKPVGFFNVEERRYDIARSKMDFHERYIKVNDELRSVVQFNQGDFEEIDVDFQKHSIQPKAVIFKNAWYHFFVNGDEIESDFTKFTPEGIARVEKVAGKLTNVLPDNGLLVIGNCSFDHSFKKDGILMETSPIADVLKKHGFVPVATHFDTYEKNIVPSIWQRIKA